MVTGVPHTSREDSTCNGYFVPKEAVVLPNIWYQSTTAFFIRQQIH